MKPQKNLLLTWTVEFSSAWSQAGYCSKLLIWTVEFPSTCSQAGYCLKLLTWTVEFSSTCSQAGYGWKYTAALNCHPQPANQSKHVSEDKTQLHMNKHCIEFWKFKDKADF